MIDYAIVDAFVEKYKNELTVDDGFPGIIGTENAGDSTYILLDSGGFEEDEFVHLKAYFPEFNLGYDDMKDAIILS